jgi:hypothetical protein
VSQAVDSLLSKYETMSSNARPTKIKQKNKKKSCNPVILLPKIYQKECKSSYNKDISTPIFTAALFTITELWNRQEVPQLMNRWRKCGLFNLFHYSPLSLIPSPHFSIAFGTYLYILYLHRCYVLRSCWCSVIPFPFPPSPLTTGIHGETSLNIDLDINNKIHHC